MTEVAQHITLHLSLLGMAGAALCLSLERIERTVAVKLHRARLRAQR